MTAILERAAQPLVPDQKDACVRENPPAFLADFFPWEEGSTLLRPEAQSLDRWLDLNA